MKNKKPIKIIAGVVAAALVVIVLLLANSLVGNPVSKMLATQGAKRYVAQTYPDMGLELAETKFNFKDGTYFVWLQSPTSIDTNFYITLTPWGKLESDSYESYVSGLQNAFDRLNVLYKEQVDLVVDAEGFPYPGYIKYGEMWDILDSETESAVLALDMEFTEHDLHELGKTYGHLILHVEDETITAERGAEILLVIRQILDEAGIGFASVDFMLQKPRIDDAPNPDETTFWVEEFAYTDIYEENLVPRLTKAADELTAYYAEQDALKN